MIGPDAVTPIGGASFAEDRRAGGRHLRRMVVDGQLKEGDFLPSEAELMSHFGVSRRRCREAVRVLESERLVEVRRGSHRCRVRVPGPEIVARPAGLLLELSGATIADIMVARAAVEPMAVRLLAESGTPRCSTSWRRCWPRTSSGMAVGSARPQPAISTAGVVALEHHAGDHRRDAARDHRPAPAFAIKERRTLSKADYEKLMRSYRRADAVDAQPARHRRGGLQRTLDTARNLLLKDSRPSRSAT